MNHVHVEAERNISNVMVEYKRKHYINHIGWSDTVVELEQLKQQLVGYNRKISEMGVSL